METTIILFPYSFFVLVYFGGNMLEQVDWNKTSFLSTFAYAEEWNQNNN